MGSRKQLVSAVFLFSGIFLATLVPRSIDTDAIALACVFGGVVLAFGGPVVVAGFPTLWRETGDRREQTVLYGASVVGWYVTIAALLAIGLSIDYLPDGLSMETVVWGLFAFSLSARFLGKLYFERRIGEDGSASD